MHEIKVVPPYRPCRVVRKDTVEHLQQVRGVEGAQDRGAVVVGCEVGPRFHVWVYLRGGFEEQAACEGECQVPNDGGDFLELRIPVIQQAGAEGRAVFGDGLVGADELVDLRGLRVIEEDSREVVCDFARGG